MRGAPLHITVLLTAAATLLAFPQEPPDPGPELIQEIAAKAEEFRIARDQYTYRQTMIFQELDVRGGEVGHYREVRDIIFNPDKERTEVLVGRPERQLRNMRLTEEDFRDIREVKPFVLTRGELPRYQVRYQGREVVDGTECYVLQVKPRQVLDGMRFFDGHIWVSVKDRQIVRAAGQPVPQIHRHGGENLFPHFTTVYRAIDGKYWFPVRTLADDTLPFRSGPQRVRLVVRYDDYKRFTAESTVQFESPKP